VDQQAHANAGLFGPIIITRAGDARTDGSPKGVDRELITLFEVRAQSCAALVCSSRT